MRLSNWTAFFLPSSISNKYRKIFMKSKLFLILFLLTNCSLFFSQQFRYWESNSQLNAKTLISTSNGGFVTAGNSTIQFGQNNYVAGFVFYSDSSGQNHWEKVYTSFSDTFSFEVITQLTDSSLIAGGNMFNPITNQLGGSLLKLDHQGNEIWKKSLSDSSGSDIVVSDLLNDSDSSFLLVARKSGNSDGNFIIRMDTSGNILWQNSFEINGNDKIELNSIKQASDKSIFIVGTIIFINGSNNNQSGILMRLDSLGNLLWVKKNNYPNSSFKDLLLDSDQLFCRNGTSFGEAIVSSFDYNGNFLWSSKFPEYEDLNLPNSPGKRKLIFDIDSNIVLYSSNFTSSSFYQLTREGLSANGLTGFGFSQGIDFYPNGSCVILISGPAIGIKSSLVTNNHFAVTRLQNFNSFQTKCLWPNLPSVLTITDSTNSVNIIPSTTCSTSIAMMENLPVFISIDNNCVEVLGSIDEIEINDFEIAPNPTKEMIQLSINSTGELPSKGYLVDALGNEVLNFKLNSSQETIDASKVHSGIYWIKIGDKSKKVIIL